jgi:hypothetical protein
MTPSPTSPITSTIPAVTPSPTSGVRRGTFCPRAKDFGNYADATLFDGGWTIKNMASVHSKAAYDLVGGSVEYDIDLTNAVLNVNQAFYTISPKTFPDDTGYTPAYYCDAGSSSNFCLEVDWLESNGNCGGVSTLHTSYGTGSGVCNSWGCGNKYVYTNASYHVRHQYDSQGFWSMFINGVNTGGVKYSGSTVVDPNAVINVNQNLYKISPNVSFSSSGFDMSKYCDGFSSNWCVEVHWLESNGNCGGVSTLHVIRGTGANKCNARGCSRKYSYNNSGSSYHVKFNTTRTESGIPIEMEYTLETYNII